NLGEFLLETTEVGCPGLHRSELDLEVAPLLEQAEAGETGRVLDAVGDRGEALLHRVGRSLPAPLRLVGFQRFEITADGPSMIAALGKSLLVRVGHRTF